MPYLQVDLPARYQPAVKRRVAAAMGHLYAHLMQTDQRMVNVGFRELGEDNLFRCAEDGPTASAVVSCDIRRGRSVQQRLALAEGLQIICVRELGLSPDQIVVQFTQHSADEMYRTGGWGREWGSAEAVSTEPRAVDGKPQDV